jgi:hypothetical protein
MRGLNRFDISIPGAIDSILNRLVGGAHVRIDIQGSLRLLQKFFGGFKFISYSDIRNPQDSVNSRHIPLDIGYQVLGC